MRTKIGAALAVLVLASTPMLEASAQNYNNNGGGTRLSRCMRQALIGAGVGAAAGLLTAPRGNRTENAALGAVIGGAGTYGVCRWLSARERQRVENNYYSSLRNDRVSRDSWNSDSGAPRSLVVDRPTASDVGRNCRTVRGSVSDPSRGRESLPPETFCRNSAGQWVPYG